jgi:hypothetical protein
MCRRRRGSKTRRGGWGRTPLKIRGPIEVTCSVYACLPTWRAGPCRALAHTNELSANKSAASQLHKSTCTVWFRVFLYTFMYIYIYLTNIYGRQKFTLYPLLFRGSHGSPRTVECRWFLSVIWVTTLASASYAWTRAASSIHTLFRTQESHFGGPDDRGRIQKHVPKPGPLCLKQCRNMDNAFRTEEKFNGIGGAY